MNGQKQGGKGKGKSEACDRQTDERGRVIVHQARSGWPVLHWHRRVGLSVFAIGLVPDMFICQGLSESNLSDIKGGIYTNRGVY